MNITIRPMRLHGAVTPPPSKSQAHRLLIAAALAQGSSTIRNVALSQDISATLACMQALGAKVEQRDSTLVITGIGGLRHIAEQAVELDCGESGTTLRMLIPVATVLTGNARFTGRGRLLQRPQEPYAKLFAEKGLQFCSNDAAIHVRGALLPGTYSLAGNVSSQFFSGLLYALALLDGDSVVESTTALESLDYIRMTIDALAQFGVSVTEEPLRFRIAGGQRLTAANRTVEADWSQAGFWYAARFLGSDIAIQGMNFASNQGDRCVLAYIQAMEQKGELSLDVSNCPDLVPPLAACAALRAGQTTHLVNAARLRMKESDRLATVTQTLTQMGASIEEKPDSLTIYGKETLAGGTRVKSHNDHRIAMMAAIANTRCQQPVTILGAECVDKSYPNFWEDYTQLQIQAK